MQGLASLLITLATLKWLWPVFVTMSTTTSHTSPHHTQPQSSKTPSSHRSHGHNTNHFIPTNLPLQEPQAQTPDTPQELIDREVEDHAEPSVLPSPEVGGECPVKAVVTHHRPHTSCRVKSTWKGRGKVSSIYEWGKIRISACDIT